MANDINKTSEFLSYDNIIELIFQAMKNLGNCGETGEIKEEVRRLLEEKDDSFSISEENEENIKKIDNYFSFALSMLKSCGGYVENPRYGFWQLSTNKEKSTIDAKAIHAEWNKTHPSKNGGTKKNKEPKEKIDELSDKEIPDEEPVWHKEIVKKIQELDGYQFEAFIQNVLRKLDFKDVTITKKSGDGGIDGNGTYMINDLIPMKIQFQCKHYGPNNTVGSDLVQQWIGAMTTANRTNAIGLFITTSSFTRTAKQVADASDSPRIVLLDGEDLINLLCKNEIGVTKVIPEPEYKIDENFFNLIKAK